MTEVNELLNTELAQAFDKVFDLETSLHREIASVSARIDKLNAQLGTVNYQLNDLLEQLENVKNGKGPYYSQNERWKAANPELVLKRSRRKA